MDWMEASAQRGSQRFKKELAFPRATDRCHVVMNLAVSARDLMPAGGFLTLRLGNKQAMDTYRRSDSPVHAGNYTLLSLIDTGSEIREEDPDWIFDLFFSMKEV
jgi:signal transduction histidine kinase